MLNVSDQAAAVESLPPIPQAKLPVRDRQETAA
jgi:hypothetical protein